MTQLLHYQRPTSRHCAKSRLTSDEGVTLVFIAMAMVGILGMTAFAVDFGRMWEERRQLQNGADAAAVAIAEDCVRGLCDGAYDEYAVAESYVDANARDNAAWAWNVDLDMAAQTVTVHNATEDPGGDHKFDMLFAGAVGFDGFTVGAQATVAWGGLGSPVSTIPIIISQCEWHRPYWEGGAGGKEPPELDVTKPAAWHLFPEPHPDAVPQVVPWNETVNPYPAWWTSPPGPTFPNDGYPYPASWSTPPAFLDLDQDLADDTNSQSPFLNVFAAPVPSVLTFHDGNSTDECAAVAGQDTNGDGMLSGGFGWLEIDDTVSTPCVAEVFNDWTPEDPGASPSTGCDKEDLADLLLGADRQGTLNFIPYFDDENGLNGANGEYHIAGYGAFYVVGYNFGGQLIEYADPLLSDPCRPGGLRPLNWTSGNDERCLVGYFVSAVYTGPGSIGPGGFGITTFHFTG